MVTVAYEYDIPSCYPRILLDVLKLKLPQLEIVYDNKQLRSQFIGWLFRSRPDLKVLVQETTKTIIETYLKQVDNDDVVLVKNDGFIVTKPIYDTKAGLLPVVLRHKFSIFVFDDETKTYVGLDSLKDKAILKGVRDKTVGIETWWTKVLQSLDNSIIQNLIIEYFTTDDMSLFAIMTNDPSKYIFRLENGSIYESSVLQVPSLQVDRRYYFGIHVKPLLRQLVMSLQEW